MSRRALLRGAGGVLIALPWLAAMEANAEEVPRRFIGVFNPNGTVGTSWVPKGEGTAFQLSPILKSLEPFQSKLNILSNLDNLAGENSPGFAHPRGMASWLTGTEMLLPVGGTPTAGGLSLDQYLAGTMGGTTRFRSIELGVQVPGQDVWARISYTGPHQALTPECSPAAALDRLFAGMGTDPAAAARLRQHRRSVLDTVLGEFQGLNRKLGAEDRHRVDSHLTSLRELEARLEVVSPSIPGCRRPDSTEVPLSDPAAFPAIGKLQMDILAMALRCDLTRVVTLQWSRSASRSVFSWLGQTTDQHSLSHMAGTDDSARAQFVAGQTWYAEQFAYLLKLLDADPEGPGGSILDHSLVLWGNELGNGSTHSHLSTPFVLAGRAGGSLSTGRHLDCSHVPHNQLLIQVARRLGADLSVFGNPAYCAGFSEWL